MKKPPRSGERFYSTILIIYDQCCNWVARHSSPSHPLQSWETAEPSHKICLIHCRSSSPSRGHGNTPDVRDHAFIMPVLHSVPSSREAFSLSGLCSLAGAFRGVATRTCPPTVSRPHKTGHPRSRMQQRWEGAPGLDVGVGERVQGAVRGLKLYKVCIKSWELPV